MLTENAKRCEQWRNLKFGLFIHWGLYSLAGGVWKGKRITRGYSEQIQSWARIPRQEYAALARRFNPTRFDPDAIVRLAKAAGMRYIVMTTKHHDGFSMFHTKLSMFNVVDATPYGRDVVGQMAAACRRHGLKMGFYFSLVDWHQGHRCDPGNSNRISARMESFIVGQLTELLTGYGPVAELWFDMSSPTPVQSKRFDDTVHKLQPDCMVNGRVWNNQGDFIVMGDNEIPDYLIRDPWQTPASIYQATWGYRSWQVRKNLAGKVRELTRSLTTVVERGGVYLLNIGPRGDGSVVEFEADVLRGIGRWLKRHGRVPRRRARSTVPGHVRVADRAGQVTLAPSDWTDLFGRAGSDYAHQQRTVVEKTAAFKIAGTGTYRLRMVCVPPSAKAALAVTVDGERRRAGSAFKLTHGRIHRVRVCLAKPAYPQQDLGVGALEIAIRSTRPPPGRP